MGLQHRVMGLPHINSRFHSTALGLMDRGYRVIAVLLMAFVINGMSASGIRAEDVPSYTSGAAGDRGSVADTALIISIDVSQSVDEERYQLQMEGIAQALEDADVISAITGGSGGGILFTMLAWSDMTKVVLPWTSIASKADALAVAGLVRNLPQQGGEFTCMGRMFRVVLESVLASMPKPARQVMLDVSSDGIDNCNHASEIDTSRDELISSGVTINGNPILVPGENDTVGAGAYRAPGYGLLRPTGPDTDMTTLDQWYRDHVIGGRGAFLLPAQGYGDFARAIKRKFVMEISLLSRPASQSSFAAAGN